jgi:hypothetical protein
MASLYTTDEIITKLKSLDEQMDAAVSSSELDTGQSKHTISMSVTLLRQQYEKYLAMLQEQDPVTYRRIFGADVIQFGGSTRWL